MLEYFEFTVSNKPKLEMFSRLLRQLMSLDTCMPALCMMPVYQCTSKQSILQAAETIHLSLAEVYNALEATKTVLKKYQTKYATFLFSSFTEEYYLIPKYMV